MYVVPMWVSYDKGRLADIYLFIKYERLSMTFCFMDL